MAKNLNSWECDKFFASGPQKNLKTGLGGNFTFCGYGFSPEIYRFILLINVTAIFTLSLDISFYGGSQYGRNEKSAYLNHLLHDNTDNLQGLDRKGVLFSNSS